MAFTKIVSPGIDTTGSYTVRDLNAVGVVTASSFSGPFSGNVTAVDGTFSGNVSIAGTLTYEDVTNIDSVGIITARSGVHVTGGSVGIGTTNPTSDLQVVSYGDHGKIRVESSGNGNRAGIEFFRESSAGTGKGGAGIWIESETANSSGELRFGTANNASLQSLSTKMLLDSNGNLGIGTDSPTANFKLDINGDLTLGESGGSDNTYIDQKQNGSLNIINSGRQANSGGVRINKTNSIGGDTTYFRDFEVYDGKDNLLLLADGSSGNIGIGTDDPGNHKLHLYGETNSDLRLTATGDDIVNIFVDSNRSSAGAPVFAIKGEWNGTQIANMRFVTGDDTVNKDDGYITFATRESGAGSSTERVRITSDGYVGINESSPIHQLSVGINTATAWDSTKNISNTTNNDFIGLNIDNIDSGANPEVGIMLQAGASSSGQYTINCLRTGSNTADLIFRTRNGGSASREVLRINSLGRVGIGTDNPQEDLHVYKANSSTAIKVETTGSTAAATLELKGGSGRVDFGVPGGSGNRGRIMYANAANTLTGAPGDRMEFFTNDDTSNPAILITSDNHVGINSSIPGSLVDIMGQTTEDAIVNIRSYNKTSAIKLWPSDDHDLDRWRMAFWENNSQTDGNNYPDWMVDGHGRQWQNNNIYIGRARSFGDSPGNQYRYYGTSGPGLFIYNGVDGDNTNYSSYMTIRNYQTDTDDRNVIYWADAGTTTTLDYDQHQKFGVKANGKVQGMYHFFAGRVESDEGSPNSVYKTSATGVYAYEDSSEASVRMVAYSEPSSSHNSFYAETGTSTANDDVQFRVRATDGRIYSDYGASVTSGADYAESFEWADGNPNNEDRVGYSVVIVPNTDGKIGIASTTDDTSLIIGVVSGCPAVLGDSADLKWQGRYLRDEYGREIMQDVEMLVWNHGKNEPQPSPTDTFRLSNCEESCRISEIDQRVAEGTLPQWAIDQNLRVTAQVRTPNPDYDPSQEYVPRSDRQEWDPVGLMGKLWLRANQPTGDRWIKLKDGSNGLSYWLVR